jgi:serine/threonine protein kinase
MFTNHQSIKLIQHTYRIEQRLGAGGQVQVWQVENQSDGQAYALRVVSLYDQRTGRQIRRNSEVLKELNERLQAEVDFLSQLPDALSQHILPCLDAGKILVHGIELNAMILPLMQDELSNYCPNLTFQPKDLTPTQFFKWIIQLSQALAYIHQHDTAATPHVHRDLKPSNVLLDQNDNAFLTDFGILKAAQHTGTTSIAFSKDCCAPEQRLPLYLEQAPGTHKVKRQYLITPQLDIYALGILMHNLLIGSTKAQDDLHEESTVDSHIKSLTTLSAAPLQIQPVGELGRLGGLLVTEQKALSDKLKKWLPPLFSRMGTMIGHAALAETNLPNYAWLADNITQFINQMLKPWPEHRPTALQVKHAVEFWQAYYTIELTEFNLSHASQADNAQIGEFYLNYFGNIGLLEYPLLDWLRFQLDGQTISPTIEKVLSSDQKPQLKIRLENTLTAGKHQLQAISYLHNHEYSTSLTFEIHLSAEQLWQQQEYTAALTKDLRPEWLEFLLAQCHDTKTRFEYMQLLEQLKQQHPQALTLLDDFYERANRLDSPQSTQSKTSFSFKPYLPVISIAGLGLISMLGWQVYQHRVPQPTPDPIDTASLLKQLQTNKATDETYEQLAQLANEAENVNAQQWVGYRYLVGNGVKLDLQRAKQWYQKAAAAGSVSAQTQLKVIDDALANQR